MDSQSGAGRTLPGAPSQECSTGQLSTRTAVTLVTDPEGATVSPATPLPVQAGRVALRRRFQKGTLIVRGKTPVRCGVYRESEFGRGGGDRIHDPCHLSLLFSSPTAQFSVHFGPKMPLLFPLLPDANCQSSVRSDRV